MDWKKPINRNLVSSVLALKTRDEAQRFLRDLLTEDEITEFARRFQTAQLLSGNIPYSSIQRTTGLSSTTIARVSKWLNGDLGGYRLVIDRLHHNPTLARGG